MLLLGVDARAPNQDARTASILVIHVNLLNHEYEVISIPHDSRDAIQAISNLTGRQTNYYAETNYWGFANMVNAIGGVTMYVPFDVKLTHAWYPQDEGLVIKQGTHFLSGQIVTEVVHERYSLPNGYFGHQQLQEQALIGIAKRVLNPMNILHIPSFVRTIPKYLVTTNMTISDMLSLALSLKGFHASEVHYYQVPGHAAMAMDPIVTMNLWYWIPNQAQLNAMIAAHFRD